MDIQKKWENLIQKNRLTFVTTLPHELVEKWMELQISEPVTKIGDFSKTTFRLTKRFGTYTVTYESHDFLFILIVEDAQTNRKLLHFDHLGLRVITDEYKPQRDTWQAFAEDLKHFCHAILNESKGGNGL